MPLNFMGMVLCGLGCTLMGLSITADCIGGEGDTDAGISILGLIAGAAVSHDG